MAADTAMIVLLLRANGIIETSSSIMKGLRVRNLWYCACGVDNTCANQIFALAMTNSWVQIKLVTLARSRSFFAQYLMRTERTRWKLPALFLAITLLRSLSKTTIIAFMAGEAIVLIWDKSVALRTKIMILLGAILIVSIFWGLLASYYDVYTNAGNQAERSPGRLGIWAFILDKALDQPWIGHGFHSVWKVIPPFGTDQLRLVMPHNELLQQFYAYGVVGIFMLIALYGSFYRQIKKLPKSRLRALLLGLFVFVLVRGLADTEVFVLSLPLWAIVMFSATITESGRREWPWSQRNSVEFKALHGR